MLLDGEDVRSLDLQALRRAISFVSQRITLFPDTVAGNIRYGRPGATDEEVRAAARVAEAEAFIDALPEGMETEIGEGGHRLSGGQRQRLSIARAVLKDAPILVLDEATSAVDNETEAETPTIDGAHPHGQDHDRDRTSALDGQICRCHPRPLRWVPGRVRDAR